MSVKHAKVSTVPDEADSSLIRPSDWNAAHVYDAEPANSVLAGPTSGGPAPPSFRALVNADIPAVHGGSAHHAELHQAAHQRGGADALVGTLDAIARTTVRQNSGPNVGSRRRLNFIPGANVALTVADDPAAEEVKITIAASGGGGGGSAIQDADGDTKVQTEASPNEDKVRVTVAGTERGLIQTTSPHVSLSGDVKIAGRAGIGTFAPNATHYLRVGDDQSSADGVICLQAALGSESAPGTGVIVGVAGRAVARNASTLSAYGLDYLAGMMDINLQTAYGASASCMAVGAGKTLTDAIAFFARAPFRLMATITNAYGFYVAPVGSGAATNVYPFYDANAPAPNKRSVLASSLQLFSTTVSLGGGVGVLGIANATTVPTSNPTGGGVLYASGGALYWRGSSGTVTMIAPA